MEFARPIGALALLALPLILWLHRARRKAPEHVVPSLQPWLVLVARAPKRRSVPPSVMLALRLAAAAALALALLEPRPKGAAADNDAEGLALFIDVTTSMTAGDRWPRALEAARSAIASTSAPVSLLAFGPRPRLLVLRESGPARAMSALAGLVPGGVGYNLDEIDSLMDAVMDGGADRSVIISDLPLSAAPKMAERAEWLTIGAPEDNLAIVALRAGVDAGSTMVTARIANYGDADVDLTVDLRLDDIEVADSEVSLQARSTREIDWRVERTARRAIVALRRSDGQSDALPADDIAYAVLDRPDIPVQLVGRSPAIERALGALDDVAIERAGLGTLRTPGEGGVAVFVGAMPDHPPAGGLIVVPQPGIATLGDPPSADPPLGDAAPNPLPPTLRLEGAGLHPLTRGLDLAGAMVEPITEEVERVAVSLLEAEGTPVIRTRMNPEDGTREFYLDFAPDRGDLRSRAAFPLLVAKLVAYAAPERPPLSVDAGSWVALPPWPIELAAPDERLELAGFGSDLTQSPGWYSVRSLAHDGESIDFAVNTGDALESDLAGTGSGESASLPLTLGSSKLEWWRIAMLVALLAILAESANRRMGA